MEEFQRLINLIGEDGLKTLSSKRVLIFGLGGVGGYVCEGLSRCGIGEFLLVDFDTVNKTNLNRQIIATQNTIGKKKTDLMKERILSINKNAVVNTLEMCVNNENICNIDFSCFDFVVDAIDMLSSKIAIIKKAKENNIKIISCMGTGKKTDPSKLSIVDINKTSMCPLAKKVRKLLKDENIKDVPVLYSTEEPIKNNDKCIASMIFVPAVAGLYIARYVVNSFLEK